MQHQPFWILTSLFLYYSTLDHAESKFEARIIGGQAVPEGKYPFMAKIFAKIGACTATILNEDSLLTAAHCIAGATSNGQDAESKDGVKKALIGRANLNGVSYLSSYSYTYLVAITYVHPSYRAASQGYDVAVVKLASKIKFDDKSTGQVCLPRPSDKADPKCVIIGWGRTSATVIASTSLALQEAPITLQSGCGYNPSIICAGGDGKTSTCNGDSGGPLMCPIAGASDGQLYQFGITSFGKNEDCLDGLNYFTGVAKFVDWIEERAAASVKITDLWNAVPNIFHTGI